MKPYRYLLASLIILFQLLTPLIISAETINLEVTGNGSGSNSGIETKIQQSTQIDQINSSEINNSVSIDANTGNNSLSENSSDQINVDTGSVQTLASISSNVNHNTVELTECCQEKVVSLTIQDNGSNSTNQITTQFNQTHLYSQSNQITITNNLVTHANTGNNHISGNTGTSINMKTGDIHQQTSIHNQANHSQQNVSTAVTPDSIVTIKKNGAGSTNTISSTHTTVVNFHVNNQVVINSTVHSHLNTGGNHLTGNTAEHINLITGNIETITAIINSPINFNQITFTDCCHNPQDPDDPQDPGHDDPSDPSDPSDDSDDDKAMGGATAASNSTSTGQVLGAVLPETGGSFHSLMLVNLFLFSLGIIMRLRIWSLFRTSLQFRLVISY